ncbi:hypothetical protein HI914_01855 [Erysiphe necator]|nr:hypothetical protein HI914_01855 [Erysiphe necator]
MEEESEYIEDMAQKKDIQNQNAYDEAYYQGLEQEYEDSVHDNDDKEEADVHHVSLLSVKNKKLNFIPLSTRWNHRSASVKQPYVVKVNGDKYDCLVCGQKFSSGNKLHVNLRSIHAKYRSSKPSVGPAKIQLRNQFSSYKLSCQPLEVTDNSSPYTG